MATTTATTDRRPWLTGKVAFITGAARSQGRAHALRLAEQGADIIAVDICADIDTNPYPLASEADLKETVRLVEATGRRILATVADVRDRAALDQHLATATATAELGRLGIVDVNLTGVFDANQAAAPTTINASGATLPVGAGFTTK